MSVTITETTATATATSIHTHTHTSGILKKMSKIPCTGKHEIMRKVDHRAGEIDPVHDRTVPKRRNDVPAIETN